MALLLPMVACAPALDWRDVRLADSGAQALFPCRPVAQERPVALAGQTVRLTLHACGAGGQTWGLASADVGDPARLGAAMDGLRAAAAANIGAAAGETLPLSVTGATPHAASQRQRLRGQRPDGQTVRMQVAVFAHGTRAFQATAFGEDLPEEAVQTFFTSLRFTP